MAYIYICSKSENIYVKKFKITGKTRKNYIYICSKNENVYVKKFKITGKWERITYIFAPKMRIYM